MREKNSVMNKASTLKALSLLTPLILLSLPITSFARGRWQTSGRLGRMHQHGGVIVAIAFPDSSRGITLRSIVYHHDRVSSVCGREEDNRIEERAFSPAKVGVETLVTRDPSAPAQ